MRLKASPLPTTVYLLLPKCVCVGRFYLVIIQTPGDACRLGIQDLIAMTTKRSPDTNHLTRYVYTSQMNRVDTGRETRRSNVVFNQADDTSAQTVQISFSCHLHNNSNTKAVEDSQSQGICIHQRGRKGAVETGTCVGVVKISGSAESLIFILPS